MLFKHYLKSVENPSLLKGEYVHNFKEPDKPKRLKISAGRAKELKKDMQALVDALQTKIPEVFERDDYRTKEKEQQRAFERHRREIIEGAADDALRVGCDRSSPPDRDEPAGGRVAFPLNPQHPTRE